MRAKLYIADLGGFKFPRTVDDLMLRSGRACGLFVYQLFFSTLASKMFPSISCESLSFILQVLWYVNPVKHHEVIPGVIGNEVSTIAL